jgi:hypothetical protein
METGHNVRLNPTRLSARDNYIEIRLYARMEQLGSPEGISRKFDIWGIFKNLWIR